METSSHRPAGALRRLVPALAALWLCAAPPAAPAAAERVLTGDKIRDLVAGTTFATNNGRGFPMEFTFEPDGTLSGTVTTPRALVRDEGRWWISNTGALCFQWERFGQAKRRCRFLDLSGKEVSVFRPDGMRLGRTWTVKQFGERTVALRSVASPTAKPVPDIHFGRYHALVIGNNDYRELPDLRTAERDARAVGDLLTRAYGFKVTLLTNATRADVIGALAQMRATLKPDDSLLIYYAGHGMLDEMAEQGYWLPVDAEQGNPTNWISTSDVTTMLRVIRAKHVMVVADSCYSGTLVRAVKGGMATAEAQTEWVKRMAAKRARTALVSGGLEPVADGSGEHSVFAKAFLDVLSQNGGVLAGEALFDAMKRPVVLNADQTPQYSDIRLAGHEGGDFLFVRTAQ